MMWIHLVTARAFLRRHPWAALTRTVVITVLALVCGGMATVLSEIDRDISRTAESIVVDIVLPDSVAQSDVEDLMLWIGRHPHVRRAEVIEPDRVWAEFQSEIGVSSSGLSEIAAMPHLVRVGFKAQHAASRLVRDFAASVQGRHPAAVQDVVLPSSAFTDVERRRADLISASWIASAIVAVLVLLAVLLTVRRNDATHSARLSNVLGPAPRWFGTGAMLAAILTDVLGGVIAVAVLFIVAPFAHTSLPWISADRALNVSVMTIAAVLVVALVVRLLSNAWPRGRQGAIR